MAANRISKISNNHNRRAALAEKIKTSSNRISSHKLKTNPTRIRALRTNRINSSRKTSHKKISNQSQARPQLRRKATSSSNPINPRLHQEKERTNHKIDPPP